MADLNALAERVEKLSGPCRETDAHIWCALNGKRYMGHNRAYGSEETQIEFTEPPKRTRRVSGGRGLPHAARWTASIDAAMTLVPEDSFWRVGHDGDGPDPAMFKAVVSVQKEGEIAISFRMATAETAALALCSAALRARAFLWLASITRTTGDGDGNNG